MDDFTSLWNRLLNRCPAVGPALAQQLINDSWHTLQARQEWSWRRRNNIFVPPPLYQTGSATTNVSIGQPTLVTGTGTVWTPQMVGSQIRIGGLFNPYYTIVQWVSPTALLIDQPWAGADVTNSPYNLLQIYYTVPQDFGYFYAVVSLNNAYRLYTNVTENELAMWDPQRANMGTTYVVAFKDYTPTYSGVIGPVIPAGATGAAPVSTTDTGFTYVSSATYIIQVVLGGISGTATYQWMRAGQSAFTGPIVTSDQAFGLMDGVMVYWPDSQTYVAGDIFIINCQATQTSGVPRYELWPAPTVGVYLYPYIYISKVSDLTPQQPQLPPFVANRGEILLEMALEQCAQYPGADAEHPNVYFNLTLAGKHSTRVDKMLIDFENDDQNVGVSNIDYQTYPFYPAPWLDGSWQQTHGPFLNI